MASATILYGQDDGSLTFFVHNEIFFLTENFGNLSSYVSSVFCAILSSDFFVLVRKKTKPVFGCSQKRDQTVRAS